MTAEPLLLDPVRAPGRLHVRLIVNPTVSRLREGHVEAVTRALEPSFFVSSAHTEGPGHATELAREAAEEGCAVVAVLGGDGTVSQAASGLVGAQTAMACLPAGVTDVFARAIGTPRDPVAAAERLAAMREPPVRSVDVGTVNGRHFLCTAGVGFTATMARAAERTPERKASLGQLHFAAAGVSEILGRYLRNPPRMRILAEDFEAEGVTAIVQNCRALTYFGPREIRLCDAAGLDTAELSVTSLRRGRPAVVANVVARLLLGRADAVARHGDVDAAPGVREVLVTPLDGGPLPLDADGEYLGEYDRVEFGVEPGALRVVS
jgi:diacylglycerol kinase family enzyme